MAKEWSYQIQMDDCDQTSDREMDEHVADRRRSDAFLMDRPALRTSYDSRIDEQRTGVDLDGPFSGIRAPTLV